VIAELSELRFQFRKALFPHFGDLTPVISSG
jgi:hypothetical protein